MSRSTPRSRRIRPWLVAAAVLVLAAALGAGWALWSSLRPLVVVGSGLTARESRALSEALQSYSRATGVGLDFRSDAGGPGGGSADVAVYAASSGAPATGGFVALGPDLRGAVIPSLEAFAGPQGVVLWTDPLEQLVRPPTPGARPRVLIPGGDDHLLVRFVGQLVAGARGLVGYRALVQATRAGTPFEALPLGDAVLTLARQQAEGLYHPNWLDFQNADVATTLGTGAWTSAVVPFSVHRGLDRATLSSTEIERPFPGTPAAPAPVAAAPVVLGLMPSAGDRGLALARWLVSTDGQAVLVRGHGLVPSNLALPPQDRQERWHRDVLATSTVVAGLDRDGFPTADRLHAFAAAVRLTVRDAVARGR